MTRRTVTTAVMVLAIVSLLQAQATRPLSPDGVASVQVQGQWVKAERTTFAMGGERYPAPGGGGSLRARQ